MPPGLADPQVSELGTRAPSLLCAPPPCPPHLENGSPSEMQACGLWPGPPSPPALWASEAGTEGGGPGWWLCQGVGELALPEKTEPQMTAL